MSTNVTWNGTTYSIPAAGEVGWSALSNFLIALGNGAAVAEEMKQAVRVATTSPVTVSDTTDCVVVTKLSVAGAVTVNLPAGSTGRIFFIVDGTGDAATNNVTIDGNSSETINGAANYVISDNYGGVAIAWNGTQWNVIARYLAGVLLSNPMTTLGDVISGGSGGTPARVAGNITTASRFLRSVGDGANSAAPTFAVPVQNDISGLTTTSSPTFAAVTLTGSSGSVYSGTYTPTVTGDGNISDTTAFVCNYMRIQNQVMVTGKFNANPITAGTPTAIGVSLPVASNFSNNRDCSGTGCTDTYNPTNVTADTTNDRATITFVPSGDANSEHRFCFMYLVQ